MYKLLPRVKSYHDDGDIHESASNTSAEFLFEAVFAGDKFQGIEAAYGRVDGVIRTATGYCGGTLKRPTFKEVCEGKTGLTEAVKVIYDKRKVSYQSLCDLFWETHDPTKKEFLNFGIDTQQRSAIFYCTEIERKQAQRSKIRKQMKLNKRIVTKITPLVSEFVMAEKQYQKFFLQKQCRLCECLGLLSTQQFVESDIACKLNGILAMEGEMVINELSTFLNTDNLSKQTKLACEDLIEELRRNYAKENNGSL
uniref:peptide-methionine (S)-S-oxide reductase n=2 Tax=Cajanus cajan TaxID=3821 RepID=A0A151SXB2_CAJCA|nr:Peptide methionine sulfoxide reductase msrA [Cajanus cajan]